MAYEVVWHPKALKELRKLPRDVALRLIGKARELREYPAKGSRPLTGSRFRSLRAGEYRAIIDVDHEDRTVNILLIGHRKHVYKGLLEL